MGLTARDIMIQDFDTIRTDASIKEAVRMISKGKVRETGYKTVSLMVTNELGQLAGVVSMFDILFHFRPSFLKYSIENIDVWHGKLKPYLEEFESMTVEQVMSTPVLSVAPEDHLMVIVDLMIKRKCRRLPVLQNSKVIGIVYLSEAYSKLFESWL